MALEDRLRIAILSVHSCPVGNLGARDTGGMSVYIRELARELGKQGHYVDVYTRVHDPADPQIVALGRNVRVIHLKAGPEEAIHKLALYTYLPEFACNLEGFRKSSGLRYNLVFSHYWLSGWVGRYLSMWWGVPHAIMFHTLGVMKNALGIGEDEPELRIFNEKELAVDCHHIIATTETEKGELVRRCGTPPEKISVIPCGVNLELFQPVNMGIARRALRLDDERIILYVGRIESLKGVEQLIKAVPRLQSVEGLRLIIIGGDEYSQPEIERLQKMSGDLDIRDSVTFQGMIKQEQLPLYYGAADVCVVPSYYESFGLVALESLACGTPVVATDVGYLRSIIRQGLTGYIIKENTPQDLADSLNLLLWGTGSGIKSPLDIRASVSRFGWAGIAGLVAGDLRLLAANQLSPVC